MVKGAAAGPMLRRRPAEGGRLDPPRSKGIRHGGLAQGHPQMAQGVANLCVQDWWPRFSHFPGKPRDMQKQEPGNWGLRT